MALPLILGEWPDCGSRLLPECYRRLIGAVVLLALLRLVFGRNPSRRT